MEHYEKAGDVTSLTIESTERDSALPVRSPDPMSWPVGCTVTRRGPLTTIALGGEFDVDDVAGLDRAAALAIDLPGLEVLVVDLCDVENLDPGLGRWLVRAEEWAARAGASVVALVEPGCAADRLRISGATPRLRVLRGSASLT